ncbi:DUF2510 domain-containing protein [Cellulomonas sp. Leaf334]|uniref:DUF2510 domain-containing protein n=1 Tax=Cellulomonas sp. Leaf334 TaxID=1736339 RepID=UPI0006F23E86|nr:DUF2510 domain-containing protein [Cellulomonas sp. Leaf334]KQR11683.1 hypothetical protein ASF78_10600 [Cellulomonas sp. Leaf334]
MTAPTTGNPPAGWYTDPAGSGGERWFDGAGWTEHVQAPPPAAPAVPTQLTPEPGFTGLPAATAAGGYGYSAPDPRFGSAAPAATSTGWIQPVEDHYLVNTAANLGDGKNTPARVALVVSVLAMLGVPIAGIAGIVLAIVGLKRATRLESAGWAPRGRGRARWALGLSIVGLVISSLLVAFAVRGALEEAQVPSAATLDTSAMEIEIAAGVAEQAGVAVSVQCPDTVVTGAATSFQCVAVDASGVPTTVIVQVTDAAGSWSWQVG